VKSISILQIHTGCPTFTGNTKHGPRTKLKMMGKKADVSVIIHLFKDIWENIPKCYLQYNAVCQIFSMI